MGTIPRDENRVPYNMPFDLAVSMGFIEGYSCINKFGRNIEIDSGVTADIWDGGHTLASGGVSLIWVAPTQARTHQIVSTDAADDGDPAGAGARTIRIYGLTDWDSAEVSEDITLNGTSNVATTNQYVIIHRMKVLTKGSTNINVGTIKATADTDNTITAQIRPGQGQTQMAVYGIPSIQKLSIKQIHASMNKAVATGVADMSLLVNPNPNVELTNFITKDTFGLQSTGSSYIEKEFSPIKTVEGPAIIKIQADSGTNDIDIDAGFDAYLINN